MKLHNIYLILVVFLSGNFTSLAQSSLDSLLPVRGLCIAAPNSDQLDDFTDFIKKELIPNKVNTLVLRVDYNYAYKSHPELQNEDVLSEEDVKKLVNVCKEGGIRIIPQVNLFGHQSWAGRLENLLKVYPEFDETPHVKIPEDYKWPNEDGLYCKSYCPLHPEVHEIVFDLMDEIVEVFETDAYHAGLDEVFYIGDDKCPRCSGRDKAELFANEVTLLRNHLAQNDKELWIWGDRLIDGKTTGIGMWEASMNQTHRAIDLIPKDVVINDWHYENAVPTAPYFAMKGFRVVTCPWRKPEVAVKQLESMLLFRESSSPVMKENFQGMMHTVWSGAQHFMDQYYERTSSENQRGGSQVECFRTLFAEIGKL
ncbi:MAG: family 20 glycosylhydrolase [Bacteroidetes bacterium]|nr:family 20 glycosylhydrolase [Bacteroidota bacterium]